MDTTWFDQDDRVRAPFDRMALVPHAAVEAELALIIIGGGLVWRDGHTGWRGYYINFSARDRRVELVKGAVKGADADWLASSKASSEHEALLWAIRAVLALEMESV